MKHIKRFTIDGSPSGGHAIFAEYENQRNRVWICSIEEISGIDPEKLVNLLNAGIAAHSMLEALEAVVSDPSYESLFGKGEDA